AEVAHWRALAGARSATLDALTQRPLVRLAVRLDQRLAPLTRRVSSGRRRFGAAVDRSALLVAGAGSRPALPRRRRRLARELDQLPPPAVAPSVSVITLAHWTDLPVPSAGTTAPQVVVAEPGPSRVAALANATTHATGEVVCFLPEPTDAPDPAWLARLAAGIGGDVVAATPTLIHPSRRGRRAGPSDLLVRSAGYELEIGPGGGPLLRSRGHGAPPDVGAHPSEVVAAPLHGLAVARTALVDAGGLLDATDDDAAAVDLIARLRARGGQVRHVPSALAYDHRPVTSRRSLEHPIDPAGPAWASVVDRWGPALVRSAAEVPAPTSWAVTTAVPSARVAERWGDWHFAQALARSLRQVGHHVVVQRLDEADSAAGRSCDLHLVLHGLGAVRRTTGQGHVLWVISHPETVTT
ncbi:MAG: hypothetical protein Q8K72_05850, partial [Acidimicrobiales bacterium]|nr:hypothetical protein [Acidimicrobiales bacterium]